MEKLQYANEVAKAAKGLLGDDYDVNVREVLKDNDLHLTGIIIHPTEEKTSISPTIYIDSYFEEGLSIDEAAEKIVNLFHEHGNPTIDFDVNSFSTWDYVKDKLIVNLVGKDRNKCFLENIPSRDLLDMAIVVRVLVEESQDSNATILVTNEHLKLWGKSADEVIDHAIHNSEELQPMDFSPIGDVLGAMLGKPDFSEEFGDCPLLVVSNKLRVKGASVISYQNTLKTLYEDIVKGTFYVLPSSVHEVLVFPSSRGAENDMQLNDMVKTVNATEVAADDVLSNHAYFFDGEHLVACA